jgi:hypothetical protein
MVMGKAKDKYYNSIGNCRYSSQESLQFAKNYIDELESENAKLIEDITELGMEKIKLEADKEGWKQLAKINFDALEIAIKNKKCKWKYDMIVIQGNNKCVTCRLDSNFESAAKNGICGMCHNDPCVCFSSKQLKAGNGYDDNGNPVQYGFGGGTVASYKNCRKHKTGECKHPGFKGCFDWEKKEEKLMTEKIQMTEKQANEIYYGCVLERSITSKKCFINGLKELGYICKSELEQLVDEAEDMYKLFKTECIDGKDMIELTEKQNMVIQALKKDHPEFKK